MKQTKRLGTKTETSRNLGVAQRHFGELGYERFIPAPSYNIKNGFILLSFNPPPLYPHIILLKSRGSFLELRSDRLFGQAVVEPLRRTLWVPLYVGKPLDYTNLGDIDRHVNESGKEYLRMRSSA